MLRIIFENILKYEHEMVSANIYTVCMSLKMWEKGAW